MKVLFWSSFNSVHNFVYVISIWELILGWMSLLFLLLLFLSFCSQQDHRPLGLGKSAEPYHWSLHSKCNMGIQYCKSTCPLWLCRQHLPHHPPVSLSSSLTIIFSFAWSFGSKNVSGFTLVCRKIYALDILGEIPRELFELKELIDLWGISN